MDTPGIILVDDHRLFRSGLKYLLESSGHFKVIGEASDGKELMHLLESATPQMIIVDINMPGSQGIDTAKTALEKYPELKILIISMYTEHEFYNTLVEFGIKGFLPKDADNEEFFLAIDKILSDETYFSQNILLNILRQNSELPNIKFSRREKEILEFITRGHSNHEIATDLGISQRTVERHRTHLLEKTGSRNSISLVIYAIKNNLISI